MSPLLACALAAVVVPTQSREVRLVRDDAAATITALVGDRPAFVYNYGADLTRPFVHPLYTPSGRALTLNSPPNHVHHHGLMLAYGNVAPDGDSPEPYVNFWADSGAPDRLGRIEHDMFEELQTETGLARIVARNEWRRISDDALLIVERRRVALMVPEAGDAYLLTWRSELRAPRRDVVIGGTPGRDVSYYGLGVRVAPDMDGGLILDANGRSSPEAVNGDRARWCAYVGGEPRRGLAMFDHPDNPRHPTGWFAMNRGFGYITASIVCHEPYPLRHGETLELCYGVLAFDASSEPQSREPLAESIERWYRRWVDLTKSGP